MLRSGTDRGAVEQASAIKVIASAPCVSSRLARWLRLQSATRDRREYAHRLTVLQDPFVSPARRSGHLLTIDQHHLNLGIGDFETLDQVRQARAVLELDVSLSASTTRKSIPKARKQTHLNPHGRRYAGFPVSSVA